MYTVYIKANFCKYSVNKFENPVELINVDNIESFMPPIDVPKANQYTFLISSTGHTKNTSHNARIWIVKLDNLGIEDPMSYVISYIHHSKKISEQCGQAVILDLTQGLPKIEKLELPQ